MECKKVLGIITGLKRELDVLNISPEEKKIIAKVSGGDPETTEELSRSIIEKCDALLSFGVAGAVCPKLRCGDIIVADRVLGTDGSSIPTSKEWRCNLLVSFRNTENVFTVSILGVENILRTQSEKAEIFNKTSGLAIDMESYRVGKVAREFGKPFLAIRVILDSASRDLPDSAINVINKNGYPKYSLVFQKLLKHPTDIISLLILSVSFNIALKKLRQLNNISGPYFCFAKF